MAVSDTVRLQSASKIQALPVTATIACLAAAAAALHVFTPFNHDEAWFIEGASRLLDGGRFGTDILDINPPPVWWLSLVPVWIAKQIGIRIDIAATVFTALMAALSLVAVERLIGADDPAGRVRRVLLPVAAILILFFPGYDFGQREHWAVLLTLPYIVARSRRAKGATLSITTGIAIGFAACVGFCLNPYFLLIPVGVEIWLLVRTRSAFAWLSPETIALGVTGLVFAGVTVVYIPNYFEHEVPKALLSYWAYNGTFPEVLRAAVLLLVPPAAIGLLGYLTRGAAERIPVLAQAFAVVGAASLVAALMQMKPWPYHFLPSVVFCGLSAAVILIAGKPRAGAGALRLGALAVLVVGGLSISAAEALRSLESGGTASRVARLAAVFRENSGPNRAVFGFITSPRDVFPAVIASGAKWAAPFCCAYRLAAAIRADEAPAASREAIRAAGREQVELALSAVRAEKPGVIVFDAADNRLGLDDRKFDYVERLKADAGFADVLRHYREIDPVGYLRVFVRN